ncbi:DUF4352 domain-containing protein [Nonomuraea sp. NN258]|uniref:DUF4352 domain-containing protein n=1 Tax=Nonomuraea antri TaxID=2730852 RepID=UPI0015692C38|nr:DUF4352 domain-containing protein [Nonomuraea antri]NRQ30359.1 DUF4352 domain-containing protein [Nonomuraea antri]
MALAVGVTLLLLGNGLTIFILLTAGHTPAAEASSPRQPIAPNVPNEPNVVPDRGQDDRTDRPATPSTLDTPDTPDTRAAARLGDTVVMEGDPVDYPDREIAVTANRLMSPVTSQNTLFTPKPGHRLVAVHLTIRNQGGEIYQEWPSEHAELVDDAGESHRAVSPGGDGDIREGQAFQLTQLKTGDRQTGLIVFEIPETAVPLTFRYGFARSFDSEIHGEWALS